LLALGAVLPVLLGAALSMLAEAGSAVEEEEEEEAEEEGAEEAAEAAAEEAAEEAAALDFRVALAFAAGRLTSSSSSSSTRSLGGGGIAAVFSVGFFGEVRALFGGPPSAAPPATSAAGSLGGGGIAAFFGVARALFGCGWPSSATVPAGVGVAAAWCHF